MKHINSIMNEYIEELKQKDKKTLSTGFYDLDYKMVGLKKGELIVIASRPTMGKTSLAFNIATNIAIKENVTVAIFSLEVSKEQCVKRLYNSELSLIRNMNKNEKSKDIDMNTIEKVAKSLAEAKMFIDDTPSLKVQEIEDKCIKLKKTEGLELVVIDYLQLIQNDECEEDICRELKKLAQTLDISIIVTSQLSKKPMTSDISDKILEIADVLLFIHKYEKHDI